MQQFECSVQGLARAKSYIRQELRESGLGEREITNFSMGLCELVMNLLDHNNPRVHSFQVAVTGDASEPKVNLFTENDKMLDSEEFAALLEAHAEPPDPLNERGRGLSMIVHCLPGTHVRDAATGMGQRCYTLKV